MGIKFSLSGQKKIAEKLASLPADYEKKVATVLTQGVLAIHRTAVKSIAAKGSSRGTEMRYNPKREQKVSAPGEPPNTDLGGLVKSIQFNANEAQKKWEVGTNLKYGRHLELGTSNMDERPWLLPAVNRHRSEISTSLKRIRGKK